MIGSAPCDRCTQIPSFHLQPPHLSFKTSSLHVYMCKILHFFHIISLYNICQLKKQQILHYVSVYMQPYIFWLANSASLSSPHLPPTFVVRGRVSHKTYIPIALYVCLVIAPKTRIISPFPTSYYLNRKMLHSE